ncbi:MULTISPECIES: iron-sulfur cluster biosynthesis protein [Actinosynnema]|uniref:iron-sulfur cluster biosynthesis protein n=1 Tax=Actinosynnema TaxID=40566 RepID=UPI0020A391F4|nr:iron-sulfur cluster biosynthesis protein [Actinosynnema pretiosum]MCP2098123.1 hypothetical protein [Actinosynnema pretiosum]
MLDIDDTAVAAIATLTGDAGVVGRGGLRIGLAVDRARGRFDLAVVGAPRPEEVVVDVGAARVFLDGGAAELLGDKVLAAQEKRGGRFHFSVHPQP